MINEALLQRWVERLRAENPAVVAILAHGSYARGEQQRHSDLDLDVITEDEPTISYRSAIEHLPNGNLLHATIAGYSMADWLAQFEEPQESEEWAYFLPARQIARLVWASPSAAERLAGKIIVELVAAPQLQDLIEGACKVRNCYVQHDDLGMRLAAQNMAIRCPAVVGMLNPTPLVHSNVEALRVALAMPNAPAHYAEDLLVCLGLSADATTSAALHMHAMRLARETVSFLQPHADSIAAWVEPDLPAYLADGRLMRLLVDE